MPHLEAVPTTTRADVWAVNTAPCTVRYQIVAEAEAMLSEKNGSVAP